MTIFEKSATGFDVPLGKECNPMVRLVETVGEHRTDNQIRGAGMVDETGLVAIRDGVHDKLTKECK